MADAAIRLEQQRLQLMASLTAAAETLRNCASAAESYAGILKQVTVGAEAVDNLTGASDSAAKSRKRKANAVEEPAEGGKKKRRARVKDPNAPKRPASSYIIFQNEVRKSMKESHPDISNTELVAMIAKQWQEMSDAEKAVYHQAMANAKERYSADKKAYDNRTPEEVAAANAAAAQLAATKRSRKPKAIAQAVPAPAPVAPAATPPDSASGEDSESEGDEDTSALKKSKASHDDDEDEGEDDDDEPDEDDEDNDSNSSEVPQPSKRKQTAKKSAPAAVGKPTPSSRKQKIQKTKA